MPVPYSIRETYASGRTYTWPYGKDEFDRFLRDLRSAYNFRDTIVQAFVDGKPVDVADFIKEVA
jgi:hypothetical protein